MGQSTINLGAASLNLRNGNFYLGDLQNTGLKSFIHAGYDIAANASLTLALNGQSDDAIHKVGAGKLTIAGTGNQKSPLNIGDGTVELIRSNGYAAPYIKIATGRATVKLGADQQLNRHFDDIENNVGLGFGRDGGTLDFAGFDTKQTWNDIYHLDAGARIVNSYPKQDVTFTFQPDGVRTYKGEFAGNLNLIYDPSKITTEPKTWYLTGNTYITGDFLVKMGGTIRVGDYQEPRSWGTSCNDRYLSNSLIAKEIAVQDKSSLIVGRNTLVQGRIVLAKGATLNIHNLGEFVSPHNPYQVPAQPTIERTIVAGELSTSDGSNVVITTNQNHRIDLYSDWSGKGRVSFQGNGYINLLGDNDKFKGTVEFCGQKTVFAVNPNILTQITNPEPQLSAQGCTTRNNMPDYAPGFATSDYIYANVISQSNADKELPSLLGLDAQGNLTSAQFTPPTWDSKKLQNLAANADKQAFHAQVAQIQRVGLTDAELAEQPIRPKPLGNSIANPTVVTFFDGDSAWNNACKVTTNGQVILHAHLQENAQWNLRNYTGDGIFVKSGTGNLYLADHNLNGLVYLVSGKLGGNIFAKDVLVKPAGQLVVNANQHTGTSIYGNLENSGSVLLTSNKEQLLATSKFGNDTTHSTNVASRFVNHKLHTIPVHTQLYIGGDYVGQNGEIEFATSDAPEQIYILGNVSGTTTLKVGAFKASTAQNLSTIDLIEAKGTIAANSFILPQGYVTGGIYDYRLQQLDNKVVLSNARLHVDEPPPAPQPSPIIPPKSTPNSGNSGNQTNNLVGQGQPQPGKQFESDGRGSITQLVPPPQPKPKPQPQPQPQQGAKPPAPQAVTQPKPKNLVLNPQDTTGMRIVQKVTWDERLVRGKPVLSKAQAAQQAEFNKRNHDLSDETTASMPENSSNLISSSSAEKSNTTRHASTSTTPTSADNTLTLATNAPQPQVGGRLINASVESLLANAQFLQQASQVPLNRLLASDGLSLTRSQAQSSLDFSGVDYGSSHATSSWTLGYATQYLNVPRYGA